MTTASWPDLVPGLTMDPWRFDPSAASAAVNLVVDAAPAGADLLAGWASSAAADEARAATVVVRIAVDPAPIRGIASCLRPDGPRLPHHPFVLADDLPFLPAAVMMVGGGALGPADFVRSCLRDGALRSEPLKPRSPVPTAIALLGSKEWNLLIDASCLEGSSRIVRWQAARAAKIMGDATLELGPASATAQEFEAWWEHVLTT